MQVGHRRPSGLSLVSEKTRELGGNPDTKKQARAYNPARFITTVIWRRERKGHKMQRIDALSWLINRFGTSMMRGSKFAVLAVVLASLPMTGVSRPIQQRERALCCLCMCHSVDENQCAQECVKMQHGTKIIEEPEMNACTNTCLRHGVRQIFFSEDGTRFVITPALSK